MPSLEPPPVPTDAQFTACDEWCAANYSGTTSSKTFYEAVSTDPAYTTAQILSVRVWIIFTSTLNGGG
jgi:hypothetical protein